MKRRVILIALLAALTVSLIPALASASDHEGPRVDVVHARMTGDQQVPTPVDSTGMGRAVFVIDHRNETVKFVVMATRIDEVTESHIHLAPAGQSGPPVAFLFDDDDVPLNIGTATEGTMRVFVSRGTITQDDLLGTVPDLTMKDLIAALTSGGGPTSTSTRSTSSQARSAARSADVAHRLRSGPGPSPRVPFARRATWPSASRVHR